MKTQRKEMSEWLTGLGYSEIFKRDIGEHEEVHYIKAGVRVIWRSWVDGVYVLKEQMYTGIPNFGIVSSLLAIGDYQALSNAVDYVTTIGQIVNQKLRTSGGIIRRGGSLIE